MPVENSVIKIHNNNNFFTINRVQVVTHGVMSGEKPTIGACSLLSAKQPNHYTSADQTCKYTSVLHNHTYTH